MDFLKQYRLEAAKRARSYVRNKALQKSRKEFHKQLNKAKYAYNFYWLGLPILQIPQDLQAMQEIIWEVKPDLIVETGIAWGGSVIFSASMLTFLEACGKVKNGQAIGIDINIRPHNKKSILAHPLGKKITMIEGSSTDPEVVQRVVAIARRKKRILVCLDSNHTHDHVLAELRTYTPLVSKGSYCIVSDTGIEDLPAIMTPGRPWGKGNNPGTAVRQFLEENKNFIIDKNIESKLIVTGSPGGYLKRIK